MKYEWRKAEKQRYLPKQPTLLQLPATHYLTISGAGDPNQPDFAAHITALYPVAYGIRQQLKQAGFEYTVYPLEGVWTTRDGSRNENLNKAALVYQLMIRQPDQVTTAQFEQARTTAVAKKKAPLINQVQFVTLPPQQVATAVHHGPFDTEADTFTQLEALLATAGLKRTPIYQNFQHREIYVSDFRRTAPEKLKTTLQLAVQ